MELYLVQRRKSLLSRKLRVKNTDPCGDVLLDEALKHMKETEYPESIQVSKKRFNVKVPLPPGFIYFHSTIVSGVRF